MTIDNDSIGCVKIKTNAKEWVGESIIQDAKFNRFDGRDCMVVGFTNTCVISVLSPLML